MTAKSRIPLSGLTQAVQAGQPKMGFPRIRDAGTCMTSAKGAITVKSVLRVPGNASTGY